MQSDQSLSARLDALLWGRPLNALPRWQARFVWLGRLVYALLRDLAQGNLSLHATSLVYTTLLSLVPLLAVSFSVLKGFGVHNQVEPLLLNALEPLGEPGVEIVTRIIGFVDNMQVGVLGSVGLATLIFTVVSLIQKIEQVFNDTWRVTAPRPFAQRASQYLSVLLIGPVLFFSTVGLSTSFSRYIDAQTLLAPESIGFLTEMAGQLGPFLMISLTFAFCYLFIPNTRVQWRSALIGALVAGLLWEVAGGMFSAFMTGSTRFMAIYSSLAILMLFMIWIHIGWSILLIGASIAFYHQHPEYLSTRTTDLPLSNRLRERLTLTIAGRIASRYDAGKPAWGARELARTLGVPGANVQHILDLLEKTGFLLRIAQPDPGEDPRYVPARAPATIPVRELLAAARHFEENASGCREQTRNGEVERIERDIEQAMAQALNGLTLRDLAESMGQAATAAQADAVKP